MTDTPHALPEEFPELAGKIAEMKASDNHFARLYDEYDEINRAVHKAETNLEPTDQFHEEDLRKKRAALKDEIYQMLTA